MTQLLHRDAHQWTELGGMDTASEIGQQPAVWRALAASLQVELPRIAAFLGDSLRNPAQQVLGRVDPGQAVAQAARPMPVK